MRVKHLRQILARSNCRVSISYYHNYRATRMRPLVHPPGAVGLRQRVEVQVGEAEVNERPGTPVGDLSTLGLLPGQELAN